MTPEALIALVSGQSIGLSDPVGGRKPQWGIVEAGWGCGGLAEPYHLAFRWRHGRDGGVYDNLRKHLLHEAEQLAWRDRWKRKISGITQAIYVSELVDIVLNEEIMSFCDRQRLLDILTKSYPPEVYEREISEKQRRIAMVLDRWCAAAHEHVARRISEDYDAEYDEEFAVA